MMDNNLTKLTSELSARERILLTAHDLFYQQGIRATGINRIIKESGVAKLTFYRHFSSKNTLILEYLQYRHERWMLWFTNSIYEKSYTKKALVETLQEWFDSEDFRGCAFINSVVELGGISTDVVEISKQHKQELISYLRLFLPSSQDNKDNALALSLAIDGAIIRAQFDNASKDALSGLELILNNLIP